MSSYVEKRWDGLQQTRKLLCGHINLNLKLFLENMDEHGWTWINNKQTKKAVDEGAWAPSVSAAGSCQQRWEWSGAAMKLTTPTDEISDQADPWFWGHVCSSVCTVDTSSSFSDCFSLVSDRKPLTRLCWHRDVCQIIRLVFYQHFTCWNQSASYSHEHKAQGQSAGTETL